MALLGRTRCRHCTLFAPFVRSGPLTFVRWSLHLSMELSFYRAHQIIREHVTGLGAGHGPYIVIHDGFSGLSNWAGFLSGSDRMVLDTHPYFAFDGSPNTAPLV